VRGLDDLRRYLRTVGTDVAVAEDEFRELFSSPLRFVEDSPTFVSAPSILRPRTPVTLADFLRAEYLERTRRLSQSIERLSNRLEAVGIVTAAAAGIRLQRRSLVIAMAAMVVAIASLVVALRSH
jgi:hypothetical protein